MGINFDCDLFWTSDRTALLGALSILPEYLRSQAAESGAVIDYRDWQVPLGRRFRSLKLWFHLRIDGVEAVKEMIREHIRLTQLLATLVAEDERFEIVAPHPLNLLCLAVRGDDGDSATDRLIEQANATGTVLFTRTVLDGRSVLRFSIGATGHTRAPCACRVGPVAATGLDPLDFRSGVVARREVRRLNPPRPPWA